LTLALKPKIGKTVSSALYQLSDSLWLHEIRENLGKLVEYMEHSDVSEIAKEFPSERFQKKVFGKVFPDRRIKWKFIQAAIAIARIKNQYPEMVKQLVYSGDKIFNQDALRFIFFRQTDRVWHIHTHDGKREDKEITSFVLLAPQLSRTISFETPEKNLPFKQFRFGRVENVQLQGSFGKIRRNRAGKTFELVNYAVFKDLKFIFRTIRDAKTIYQAKRLENFSFVTTSEADENSFKTAFYFVFVGRVTNYGFFKSVDVPATMKKISIIDDTDSLEFQMADGTINHQQDPMYKSIQEFFQAQDENESGILEKNSFVVALARWPIGDALPEILYLKKLGKTPSKTRLEAFYMLAYLNSRKKVPIQILRENFPTASTDAEHFLEYGNYAYLLQFNWEKETFTKILDKAIIYRDFSFIGPEFPTGLYFHINDDAKKLYLSNNPENDFAQIFNTTLSSWAYCQKQEDFVIIGKKPLNIYVAKAILNLSKIGKTTLVARGNTISRAVDISQMIIKIMHDVTVQDIQTSSELKYEDGKHKYISNIRITLAS